MEDGDGTDGDALIEGNMNRLTDREMRRLREIAWASLLARPSHSTKIELVTATVEVKFRDGNVTRVEERAWK